MPGEAKKQLSDEIVNEGPLSSVERSDNTEDYSPTPARNALALQVPWNSDVTPSRLRLGFCLNLRRMVAQKRSERKIDFN